jgi:hypothetical protein
MSQVRQLDVRDGAGGTANDVLERKRELEEQVSLLQREADTLQAFQQAKANTVRTQILAMDLASTSVQRAAARTRPGGASGLIYDLVRGLVSD